MRKSKITIAIIILIILSTLPSGCTQESKPDPLSENEFMLGTFVRISIYDHKEEETLSKVFDRLRQIENRMSINIANSDISKINENAGIKSVKVHDDVYFVLDKAKYYAKISNGAFDPTIGPLVELWGIGTEHEQIPKKEEIDNKVQKVDYNKLQLLDDNKVFLEEKEMVLDLGGIAKGYAADEAIRILIENGVKSAIIDLGGNIFVLGSKTNKEGWRIGVQNPFKSRSLDNYVGIVQGKDMSVVTSGNYERYFEEDGVRYHHILSSKTGYPARNNVMGISVLSNNSIDGDALSTAFYVMGIEEGLKLVEELEGIEVIYITKDKKLYMSSGLIDELEDVNNKFKIATP